MKYEDIRKIQIEDEEIAQHFTKEAYAGYKVGKREMRESAAELSLKAEARIEELEDFIRNLWIDCNSGQRSAIDNILENK